MMHLTRGTCLTAFPVLLLAGVFAFIWLNVPIHSLEYDYAHEAPLVARDGTEVDREENV